MTDFDSDLAAVVDIRAAGVPEWHQLSVEAARRVEDEVFTPDDRSNVTLARDLAFDGPEVAHLHYPSMAHGFLSPTDGVPAADEALDDVVSRLP